MSVKAITSIDDHTIYGVGLHHGPSSEEVPTWKDHKGKADKSELEGKADKSVEDEFRNKDTGFKATRGWIEWLVNCMFNEIENDDKTKHPGVFKRIDSLSKDKADKKSIEESIKAIADKINSGGGIRDSLGNLLDEHLKQIGIECAKHESSIKAAINEHSEVRDKITRLVNEHCEFVNSKLGELKEYLDTCSNSFVAIKDELSGKQEIINNQLNEVSQKHSDFTFLCNKSEEIIANAISEIKDRADNFAKDADTRDGKIKDISDSTVKDLENKKTELTSLFESQSEKLENVKKVFEQEVQRSRSVMTEIANRQFKELSQKHSELTSLFTSNRVEMENIKNEISQEIQKCRSEMTEIQKFKTATFAGRIKWILTGTT